MSIVIHFVRNNEDLSTTIITIICIIFILFLPLIFNELIEINLWGLSDNTKRNITERGESEDFDIKKTKKLTIDENEENEENDRYIDKSIEFENKDNSYVN